MGCSTTSARAITVTEVVASATQAGVTLTAASNQTGATYQWIACNNGNLPIAGATNPVYSASSNGSYAVVVSYQGCNDTSACLNVTTASIRDVEAKQLVVVSYLTSSQLMINTGEKVPVAMRLFDVQGKLVMNVSPEKTLTLLDASNLASGVYFLHCYFRDQRVINKVLIQ